MTVLSQILIRAARLRLAVGLNALPAMGQLCIGLCVAWPAMLVAQSEDPNALMTEAERLYWLDNWVKARPLYERAEELFEAKGDARNAALARISRLRADADRHSYPEASQQLAKELENPTVANDPHVRLRCLMVKATIDLSIDPPSSADTWREALELANTIGEARWVARIQGELGIVAFLEGNSTEARGLMTKAIMSAAAAGDLAGQIRALSLIGVGLSELGEYERSLRYFDQALDLSKKNPEIRFPLMAHMGKAHSLNVLGRSREAQEFLERAVRFVEDAEMNVYRADILQALSEGAIRTKDYKSAVSLLTEAVQSAKRFDMPRPRAAALLTLSRVYKEMGEMEKADECASEAVIAARELVDMYVLPRHLAGAAEIKVLRGKITEADSLYEEAGDLIEAMLVNVPSARMRSTLVAAMSEVYVGHFALAAEKQGNPARAFEILERARGRAAADALRAMPLQQSRRDGEKAQAERQVVALQIRLQQAATPRTRKELLDQLAAAEEALAPLHLEQHRFNRFLRGEPVSLEQLRKELRADELIVEYLLAEPASFALVISKTTLRVQKLSSRKAISDLAQRFHNEVKTKRATSAEAGASLSAEVIRPIPEILKSNRVIFVPDGLLHLTPFDALTFGRSAYLGDRRTISVAPSATVLQLIRTNRPSHAQSARLLAVGNAAYPVGGGTTAAARETRGMFDPTGSRIARLPSTADEVAAVAAQAGPRAVVLDGKSATETAFKSQPLHSFSVLHLAVHGVADSKFPDRSALVFGSDPASDEDGLLQVREIDSLQLNADLVTLSACDTGAGRLQGQEGVANVVRAFLYAGARSIVSTLWEVDDTFTAALMKRFYANLGAGRDVSESLRLAKLEMRRRLGPNATPYLWGPFTVVGDGLTKIHFSAAR
ncbi:MAG: CHAT domain-containing protein [Acidobacteria bacterium]|nr:CHAT domain-containing protein [Acidobacteriota bacterium]